MSKFLDSISNFLKYRNEEEYDFILPNIEEGQNADDSTTSDSTLQPLQDIKQEIYASLNVNLEYVRVKYNGLINSDVKIREFSLTARNRTYSAFLLYIDGLIESKSINDYILEPLMLRNRSNTFDDLQENVVTNAVTNNITVRRVKRFDLIDYIYDSLIPQNDAKKAENFEEVITGVNSGGCALFVDTINTCFLVDVKGFEKRGLAPPQNEIVIRGAR